MNLTRSLFFCTLLLSFTSQQTHAFFDTSDREAVTRFFNETLQQTLSNSAPSPIYGDPNVTTQIDLMNWTGDISTCTSGDIATAYKNYILKAVNWARIMAGMGPVQFKEEYNQKAQAGAFLMAANQDHSHYPPKSWRCWTQDGYDGLNSANTGIIPIWLTPFEVGTWSILDGGSNNDIVGHRRRMLYPPVQYMGTGKVPAPYNGFNNIYNTLYIPQFRDNTEIQQLTRDPFVAWPPKGYVPYQTVYSRWHIEMQGADFSNATVTMTTNGETIPLTVNPPIEYAQYRILPGFALFGGVLVWNPYAPYTDGGDWPKTSSFGVWPRPANDTTYNVTISNVMVYGKNTNITYDVTIIDPSSSGDITGVLGLLLMGNNDDS